MRAVFGIVFMATMAAVFTLITVVVFVTQHLFASLVLAVACAMAVGTIARRRRARQPQWAPTHLGPASWPALEMSSAPGRLPHLHRGGSRHE